MRDDFLVNLDSSQVKEPRKNAETPVVSNALSGSEMWIVCMLHITTSLVLEINLGWERQNICQFLSHLAIQMGGIKFSCICK